MKIELRTPILLAILHILHFSDRIFAGRYVSALPYDYTASIECLDKPHRPQYGGGIIINPEGNKGMKGWSPFGNAKLKIGEFQGNKFLVAHGRTQPYDSISQKLSLQRNLHYMFSAWIQVNEGSTPVMAVFKTASGYKHAGAVVAESKCWSMLKGGITPDVFTDQAELYFESNDTSVEIWVDSISLQPFTEKEWRSHQQESIEKTRKGRVRIQAVDAKGNPLQNATLLITRKRPGFPFGCSINKNILSNRAYQNWFTSRFTVTTFEDEMKWYSTEPSPGRVDYRIPDAMLQFAKQHRVAVRGHNVIWDDPRYQVGWVRSLSSRDLFRAVLSRINSIVLRYRGQIIGWDVVNENLHFNFFESKLGKFSSGLVYNLVGKADPRTTLFMNEYNTIEDSRDSASTPARYLQKIREIRSFPGNRNLRMGIGLEGHFNTPNIPYIRASIDVLASSKLPIWITEVDVQGGPQQAQYLEQILREAFSHPKVSGIVIWSAWSPRGCYRMCLTDNNFRNLATGNVVDKLLREWGGFIKSDDHALQAMTDSNGFFEDSFYLGYYDVKISHPSVPNASAVHTFKVAPPNNYVIQKTFILQVN